MTIPTLKKSSQQRETEAGMKKAYSSICQAIDRMDANGEMIRPSFYAAQTFYYAFSKYFNLAKACGLNGCAGFTSSDEGGYNVKDYKTYNYSRTVYGNKFDDGQFITNDGMLYMLENPGTNDGVTDNMIFITVDVNGIKKGPNAWGRDLFTFQLMSDGSVLPMGAEGTFYNNLNQYCSVGSSDAMNGIACAQRAFTEKDFWKE